MRRLPLCHLSEAERSAVIMTRPEMIFVRVLMQVEAKVSERDGARTKLRIDARPFRLAYIQRSDFLASFDRS